MPPLRTISATKPVKTERTHEENQERAYIAASRRSDRSLEARIESARRASEIHKKRTGRALRVTEQDVVNEEMYEEEDDDLPAQYRRLTAHLQTNSMDFNRRLHMYLASQTATRAAIASQYDPAFANSYSPQFHQPGQYPQMMHPFATPQMLPPQMFHHQSPTSYRHTPYPMAQANGYRPHVHNRAASISTAQEMHNFHSPQVVTPNGEEHRRMSLPPQAFETPSHAQTQTQHRPSLSRSSTGTRSLKQESPQPNHESLVTSPTSVTTPSNTATSATVATPASQPEANGLSYASFMPGYPLGFDPSSQHINLSPFSMSLPAESQQLLSTAMDPHDPRTSMYMAGSEMIPQPFYSYNPNPSQKQRAPASSGSGMDQTLAPGSAIQVDTTFDPSATSNPPSATTAPDGLGTPFTPTFGYDTMNGFADPWKGVLTRNNSTQGSADGNMTPGEWSSLIDGSMWENPV